MNGGGQRPWLGYFTRWWGTGGQQQPVYPVEVITVGEDEPDDGALNALACTATGGGGLQSLCAIVAGLRPLFVERFVSTANVNTTTRLKLLDRGPFTFVPDPSQLRIGGSAGKLQGTQVPDAVGIGPLPVGWVELGRLLVPVGMELRLVSDSNNVNLTACWFYREAG